MSHTAISDFTNIKLEAHIKTVLLDLDNTCYRYEPCHKGAQESFFKAIEKIVGPTPELELIYKEAQLKVKGRIPTQASSHSRILYAQTIFELLGRKDGHLYAPYLENEYWSAFIKKMEKVKGLDTFLANCQKSDTTVVVISDLTTAIQCQKLLALNIAKSIDFLVTAEEVGADKPDPKPFLVALEKANGKPESSIVIGDNYERDIKGAISLGIDSILITHDATNKTTLLR